ncbi:CPBP family intramembrane metalloprotease [Clostridium swellfunianum]|uniref:CPBP family intramembrane glutamic endopeptidase n=1 Tax=Clostridium swellfunianum TaxID=1367462 RepID=UPI00203093D1|nr:CPBP family intramembrane glutamic endopeptidase [Clostridium swellfunianum]MCM0650157.1 CPBP family intramembrane metalloprotease [Clostridium swellfunianum]
MTFKRYPIIAYFLTTMIASILLLIPHLIFGVILTPSFSLTQFGPACGLLIWCGITKEKYILEDIRSRFRVKKFMNWVICMIIYTFVIIFLCSFLLALWGEPFIPWQGMVIFYIVEAIAMLICCAAEEVGWRGLLLPLVEEKYPLFKSSIIVGVLWGAWHLNFTGGIFGFILYTISIVFVSAIMTWIFNKTDKNMTLMVLEHFCFNLFSHIFLWNRFNIKLFVVEILLFGLTTVLLLIIDKPTFAEKKCINI